MKVYSLSGLEEHTVVNEFVMGFVGEAPKNVSEILYHGSTEMINNAIDHSEGTTVTVTVERNEEGIRIYILDNGVGIFEKIQKLMNLETPHDAILELCKGKLTTDPARHTGEGILLHIEGV